MAERLGVGLIGAGGIAQTHAAAYAGFPELARLVAVADIDGDRARSFAEGHGIPHVYEDYEQMLARDDVSVVSSCTPAHSNMLRRRLRRWRRGNTCCARSRWRAVCARRTP